MRWSALSTVPVAAAATAILFSCDEPFRRWGVAGLVSARVRGPANNYQFQWTDGALTICRSTTGVGMWSWPPWPGRAMRSSS